MTRVKEIAHHLDTLRFMSLTEAERLALCQLLEALRKRQVAYYRAVQPAPVELMQHIKTIHRQLAGLDPAFNVEGLSEGHDQRVAERFSEWQRCRAQLRAQSERLAKALRDGEDVAAPNPDDQPAQLGGTKKECDARFMQLLEAMNDRTRARQQQS